MDSRHYSLPAGVYSDVPESYQLGREEKRLLKTVRASKNIAALPNYATIQKELKGRSMGSNLVARLANNGQLLVAKKILSYLNWIDVTTILILGGIQPELCLVLGDLVEQIFVRNTAGTAAGDKYSPLAYFGNLFYSTPNYAKLYLLAVDTTRRVFRMHSPNTLVNYYKALFREEQYNERLGENLLKEYR